MKATPANPFVFGQVLGPRAAYCPRPDLEQAVRETAENRQRLVLLGDRRVGKTSLVERTLARGDGLLLSVDLLGLASVEDFLDRLLTKLAALLSENRGLTKHLPPAIREAASLVSSLRLELPFAEIEARPGKASTVIQAMGLLGRVSRWRPLTVFFDEFQEIADRLDEKSSHHLLGVLRSEIQRQDRIAYVFAGSARESLSDIFTASQSPFYQSARILDVGPIPKKDMAGFLASQFARGGRAVSPAVMAALFDLAGENPNDLQQLAYHLWARSGPGALGPAEIRAAIATLMAEVGRTGERILDAATPSQRGLLFALALGEGEVDLFGADFRQITGFRTHQAVDQATKPFLRTAAALLEKQGSRVRFRERFVRIWVLSRVLRNPHVLPAARERTWQWAERIRPFLAGLLQ